MFPLMFPRTHLSRHKPDARPLHRQPLSYCHKPGTRPLYKHSSPATNRTPVPCTSIPLPPQTGRPSPVQPPPLLPHAAATLCLSSYRQHALLRLPGCLNVGIFLSRTFIRRFYHYFNNYPL